MTFAMHRINETRRSDIVRYISAEDVREAASNASIPGDCVDIVDEYLAVITSAQGEEYQVVATM
jgi:hypothetical protein